MYHQRLRDLGLWSTRPAKPGYLHPDIHFRLGSGCALNWGGMANDLPNRQRVSRHGRREGESCRSQWGKQQDCRVGVGLGFLDFQGSEGQVMDKLLFVSDSMYT
ncbi:hypothetical protein HNY73_006976 [Argiope bruennichi]|uniref:Uncharacterized protein n=1 Tax=Argiope bruennichi TaxID=94029 RepID=A0A8T0FCJ4_ARGBR|nr:hypothetical protein HNY73_006976 [Argiope bruennichi]